MLIFKPNLSYTPRGTKVMLKRKDISTNASDYLPLEAASHTYGAKSPTSYTRRKIQLMGDEGS